MSLNLSCPCPWLLRLSHPFPSFPKLCETIPNNHHTSLFGSLTLNLSNSHLRTKASLSESESSSGLVENPVSALLDDELLTKISAAKDAHEALEMIAESSEKVGGVVSVSDCCIIISAALERNNPELALSVFYAMRASFDQGVTETGAFVERWKWSRPDVRVYTSLIQGLAASLRVSDALRMINNICQVGVSPGEEVPFGKVVRCPSCTIAIAVAQPQQGIQIASCSKCRYKYELVSGDIVSIESEEISINHWNRYRKLSHSVSMLVTHLVMCAMLILGYWPFLRISSCRTQHGCSSMEKGTKISTNNEAKHSCCRSLHCGPNPFWCGTYTQVCY